MTTAWGNATDRILAALREHGPLTRVQAQQLAGIDKHTAGQVFTRLLRVTKRSTQAGLEVGKRRAHISGWTSEHEGARDYLRAIYKLGDGKDAPRPKPKCMLKVKREYWKRRKQRLERFAPGAELQAAWQPFTATQPPTNP
jgi:hypothetical protein